MTFQQIALLLTVIWLALIVVRFRRSIMILIGGLVAISLYALAALANGATTPAEIGLSSTVSWLPTIGLALTWLGLMLVYSPLADRLATRWIAQPPVLAAFGIIQQSTGKLIAGIIVAWLLGGVLEELVVRGVVLTSVESVLTPWLSQPLAAGIAVCLAAVGAGLGHSYQGPRAMIIVTQLSILLGGLFVISGHNLWAVMICHGLYDTLAFIRFANHRSKYSRID
jgi:membrane protease YdiL (CAAX protease family)